MSTVRDPLPTGTSEQSIPFMDCDTPAQSQGFPSIFAIIFSFRYQQIISYHCCLFQTKWLIFYDNFVFYAILQIWIFQLSACLFVTNAYMRRCWQFLIVRCEPSQKQRILTAAASMNLSKACAQPDSSTALLGASSCATAPRIQLSWQKFYARSSKLCR